MAQISKVLAPKGGTVGDVIFYERNGKMYMRSKPGKPANPTRTPANMRQKCKWANMIAAWRTFGGSLRGCFDLKKAGQSDYNAFVGVNSQRARVYLTKKDAELGACVAEPFVVAMGSLVPPVEVQRVEDWWASDVCVDIPEVLPEMSVSALTDSLLQANGDLFREGDELLFVRLLQREVKEVGVPMAEAVCQRFTLNARDSRPLREVMRPSVDGTVDGFAVREGVLCAPVRYVPCVQRLPGAGEEASMVAWVRRRPLEGGRWQATSQTLVGGNPLAERYTTPEAMAEAILSYGPLHSQDRPRIQLTESDLRQPVALIALTAEVSSPEAGWVEGAGSYEPGAEAVLNARPREGWRFLCWDDGVLEAERVVRVEAPQRFKAVFIKK